MSPRTIPSQAEKQKTLCITLWGTQKNSWLWFCSNFQSTWADEKDTYNYKIDVPIHDKWSPVLQFIESNPWEATGGSSPCFNLLCAIHFVQSLTWGFSKPDKNPSRTRTVLPVLTLFRKLEQHPSPAKLSADYKEFPDWCQAKPWTLISNKPLKPGSELVLGTSLPATQENMNI